MARLGRRWSWCLDRSGALPLLVGLLAALATATPARAFEADLVPSGDARRGRDLFLEKGCGNCHSLRGVGEAVVSDLASTPVDLGFVSVVAEIWSHIPDMRRMMKQKGVPFPSLSPKDVRDLISYVLIVRMADEPEEAVDDPDAISGRICAGCHVGGHRADAAHGEQVLVAAKCDSCHAEGGQSSDLRRSPARLSPANFVAAAWENAEKMSAALAARDLEWPRLSAEELEDLLTFLND